MGMLGEMFPGPKIRDEAGEDGDAQKWRLGPIDLDRGVVEVHRVVAPTGADPAGADPVGADPVGDDPAGDEPSR